MLLYRMQMVKTRETRINAVVGWEARPPYMIDCDVQIDVALYWLTCITCCCT
jgi:hypothetical protein